MTVTGLGNLAVKVSDLDAAVRFYAEAGASIGDRGPWHGGERADVRLGPLLITLFTRALYEDSVSLPDDCFLHLAMFTDDVDGELAGHTVVWGPAEVEGTFGRRRIAFVEAPGDMRLEFMEQLDDPPTPAADSPPSERPS
jgi:catechol 2,3-dioxygenase-like lactoylglutathione lyase family enzyme